MQTTQIDPRRSILQVPQEEMQGVDLALGLARLAGAFLPVLTFGRVRAQILRLAGFKIGRGTMIWDIPTFFGGPGLKKRLTIGSYGVIGVQCVFDVLAPVTIGDQVTFGPQVMIITGGHEIGSADRRAGKLTALPVQINNGAWIGARSTILPGVTVGSGAIIGAGSLVNRDVPPNTIAAGVPAKVIRTLDE